MRHGIFSLRKEDGLKLYARKVLIQEYSKDLLPEYCVRAGRGRIRKTCR